MLRAGFVVLCVGFVMLRAKREHLLFRAEIQKSAEIRRALRSEER